MNEFISVQADEEILISTIISSLLETGKGSLDSFDVSHLNLPVAEEDFYRVWSDLRSRAEAKGLVEDRACDPHGSEMFLVQHGNYRLQAYANWGPDELYGFYLEGSDMFETIDSGNNPIHKEEHDMKTYIKVSESGTLSTIIDLLSKEKTDTIDSIDIFTGAFDIDVEDFKACWEGLRDLAKEKGVVELHDDEGFEGETFFVEYAGRRLQVYSFWDSGEQYGMYVENSETDKSDTEGYTLDPQKMEEALQSLDKAMKTKALTKRFFAGEEFTGDERTGQFREGTMERLLDKFVGKIIGEMSGSSGRTLMMNDLKSHQENEGENEDLLLFEEHELVVDYFKGYASANRFVTNGDEDDEDDGFFMEEFVVNYKGTWLIGNMFHGYAGGSDSYIGLLNTDIPQDEKSFKERYRPFDYQDAKDYWEHGKLKGPEDPLSIVSVGKQGGDKERKEQRVDEFLKQVLTDDEFLIYKDNPIIRQMFNLDLIEKSSVFPVGDVRFILLKEEMKDYPIGWESALQEVALKTEGLVNPVYVFLEDGLLVVD